jgi:hypothetical protein
MMRRRGETPNLLDLGDGRVLPVGRFECSKCGQETCSCADEANGKGK